MRHHTWEGERTNYGRGYDARLLGKPNKYEEAVHGAGSSESRSYRAGWFDADRDLAEPSTPKPNESLKAWRDAYTWGTHAP